MNLNIGIDVSKSKLDICLLRGSKVDYLQILNNHESINGLFVYLEDTYKKDSFRFGYEATNNYMNFLREDIDKKGYLQTMVNPYQMSHFLKHLDLRDKTDKKDSLGIAKFISQMKKDDFKTTYNSNQLLFKKYNTTLSLLSKISTQLSNLVKSQKDIVSVELDDLISKLRSTIKSIKKDLEKLATKLMYKLFPQTIKIKNDIKGVGDSLLLQLVPIFLNSKNYTIKQIQSFIGLTPRRIESGTSIKHKEVMSKRGNSEVRKNLYLSSMVAIRFNDVIKEKYERLIINGKEKMVALIACMCHLLRAVFIKFNEYSISSK